MNQHNSIAAFFDFDETLLAIDSAGIGFKVLRAQGYITRPFMLKMILVMFLMKFRFVDEQTVAKAMLGFYRGRSIQPFMESAEDFYQEYLKPNLSPAVLEKLRWHQAQGHKTILVTGSIDYYLEPVMRDLGIDHLLCTHLETGVDGLLTGRSQGPVCVGSTKVDLAIDLAKEHGIDLSRSFAYGNSHLDIPILARVGHPIIVNPSPSLIRHAEKKGWSELEPETG
ncbi:MAG: HAD-IB family hydrolase [Candidatus Marinimicrobia bacterium]|nr:HAD-IB family hydrolase [Candidatus Neomarinimicrobiota bacterium]